MNWCKKKEKGLIVAGVIMTAIAGLATHAHLNAILLFLLSAVAIVVGHATDRLGKKLGPSATGILQSALGNLPELFICIFALKAGLDGMVKAALIGSILGNSLLVFGLAILLGELKMVGKNSIPNRQRWIRFWCYWHLRRWRYRHWRIICIPLHPLTLIPLMWWWPWCYKRVRRKFGTFD